MCQFLVFPESGSATEIVTIDFACKKSVYELFVFRIIIWFFYDIVPKPTETIA